MYVEIKLKSLFVTTRTIQALGPQPSQQLPTI